MGRGLHPADVLLDLRGQIGEVQELRKNRWLQSTLPCQGCAGQAGGAGKFESQRDPLLQQGLYPRTFWGLVATLLGSYHLGLLG